jgi:hypothetical protein
MLSRAYRLLGIIGLILFTVGCRSMKQPDSQSNALAQADELAARLAGANLSEMATALASDPQVTALWREHADPRPYTLLVEDPGRPDAIRFGAALVLFSMSKDGFRAANPSLIAQVFAAALKHDLTVWTWPWGKLWAEGDPVGTLGRVFLDLGRAAVPSLESLLDDEAPRTAYEGSEEATELARRHYRVKDFAAYYLARITNVTLPWEPRLPQRDEAIAKLRAQLP